MTTNPTIFAKALSDADDYDGQLKRPRHPRRLGVEEAARLLTDLRRALGAAT